MRASFVTLIVFCAVFPSIVVAHGTGASFESESGPYVVDIGYEPEVFEAGEQSKFDFSLTREGEEQLAAFAQVWVRILQDGKTVFASGVHRQDFGPTTLLYTFPEKGGYELEASYRAQDGEIASATFPISVAASGNSSVVLDPVSAALGAFLAFGVAAAYVFLFRKRSSGVV